MQGLQDRCEGECGCLILLQLSAWSRLYTLAPMPRGPSLDNSVIWGDRPGPYGMRIYRQTTLIRKNFIVLPYRWYAHIARLYHTRVGGSHLFAVESYKKLDIYT
ncbi:hypothetical protein POM88_039050 [Heracleum sosnowskyi]|uniref:Uncharacterized protein n=1 Tax=Heracleum sosnowskyi TaxID=360622 RepID=A0AAD8HAH4_9APIA|nr:hypothetical protein POM88_039050 [Heracleum sosnowskyi]